VRRAAAAAWSAAVTLAACTALKNGGAVLPADDAGGEDATTDAPPEAGAIDAGAADSGTADTGAIDSGAADMGAVDSGGCPDPCPLATGLDWPLWIASDSARVYWTERGDPAGATGAVKGCAITGCDGGPAVYQSALSDVHGIAVDDQNVYFATGGASAGVWACAIGGCPSGALNLAPGAMTPDGVAVDATYVYWVDFADNSVHRAPKMGGADQVLHDGGGSSVTQPQRCRVDGAFVYVTDTSGDVVRIPLGGGDPIAIDVATTNTHEVPLALDSTYVYYGLLESVFRSPKTATDSGVAIANGLPKVMDLEVAGGDVLWADLGSDGTDGTVGRVHADGGGRTLVATSLVNPGAVTVSAGFVFWLSQGPGTNGTRTPRTGALYRRPL
jgi:hypothetical protein